MKQWMPHNIRERRERERERERGGGHGKREKLL
jgi:hypothetical protein